MWEANPKALRALNDAAVKAWAYQATDYVCTLKLAVAVDEREAGRPAVILLGDPMPPEQVVELLLRAADDYERYARGEQRRGQVQEAPSEGHAAHGMVPGVPGAGAEPAAG